MGYGVTVVASEITVLVSKDGTNFVVNENVHGVSQSASIIKGTGGLALAGSWRDKAANSSGSLCACLYIIFLIL